MEQHFSLNFFVEQRLGRFGLEQFNRSEIRPPSTPESESNDSNTVPSQKRGTRTPRHDSTRERLDRESDIQLAEADLNAEMLKDELTVVVDRHQAVLMNWNTADDGAVETVKADLRRTLGLRRDEKILFAPNIDRDGVSLTVSSQINPLHVHAQFSRRWKQPVTDVSLNLRVVDRSGPQLDAACRRLLELESKLAARPTISKVSGEKDGMVIDVSDQRTGLFVGRVECDERGRVVRKTQVDAEAVRKLTRPELRDFDARRFQSDRLNAGEVDLLKQSALTVLLAEAKEYLLREEIQALPRIAVLLQIEPKGENQFRITVVAKQSELELGVIEYDRRVRQPTTVKFDAKTIRRAAAQP